MNAGNLDILCTISVLAPARGTAGEVLTRKAPWKELEKMWMGRKDFNGKALPTASREANQIEIVFEGWWRGCVVPGLRLTAQGVMYNIVRVDPANGRQWMLVYCQVVK